MVCGASLYKTLLSVSQPSPPLGTKPCSGENESQTDCRFVPWFSLSVTPDSLFVENKNEKCIIFPSLEGWLMHSNCVPIALQIAVHLEVHSDMKSCRTL